MRTEHTEPAFTNAALRENVLTGLRFHGLNSNDITF
jgi:hypothetical protein